MNAPANPSESTALAVAARQQFGLVPQSMDEALQFADYLAASELVPKNYRGRPADCFIALAWGMEVGLKPIQSINSIATINGKPGIFGDAGKAILLSHGCIIEEDDTEVVKSKTRGRCKITRPGRPPTERTFSLEDAKTAGLWGKEGPWKTYPWRQMAWRAFWFAARDCAADLLRGMAGAEELADYPSEPRDMGPADVVQPTAPAPYPQDQFDKNLPAWTKVIESGRKTADQIIAMAETKHPLTDDQKAMVRKVKAPVAEATPGPASTPTTNDQPQDVAIKVTYADVASKLESAKNDDELATAGDLIGEVSDPQQRTELQAIYDRREAELSNT